MAMFPTSSDGALETHGVLMGWEMKLLKEAVQMPMVSVFVLSTLPPSYTSRLQCLLHCRNQTYSG